jgi:anti-sigma regulatory factor (Ser/Thr protein kinase)
VEKTVDVHESSQVAEVRRLVAEMAADLDMSQADLGRAALVATEACTNLVKYGRNGRATVSTYREGGACGIQLVAMDDGPGFADFDASSRDGHSTSGSLGIGLGAIIRVSDLFEVHTARGIGSVLLTRIAKDAVLPTARSGSLMVGGRSTPFPGEQACGDAWACAQAGRWQRLCVVDGLGHGPLAASAAGEAIGVFLGAGESATPAEIVTLAHAALRSGRGAVMAVLAIDTAAGQSVFAGVGNITGRLQVDGQTHHCISTDGVVGYNMRPVRDRPMPWGRSGIVMMATDGLGSRWSVARHADLLARHPALIAAVLHRDFARDSDDSTIAVAKEVP